MEKKFYTNDFERLLKENADQFKMSPSKKVWNGIYNDIHPGRRWPSITISLVFLFTLILVGHLNTQQSAGSYVKVQTNNPLYTVKQPANIAPGAKKSGIKYLEKSAGLKGSKATPRMTARVQSQSNNPTTKTGRLPANEGTIYTAQDNTLTEPVSASLLPKVATLTELSKQTQTYADPLVSIVAKRDALPVLSVKAAALSVIEGSLEAGNTVKDALNNFNEDKNPSLRQAGTDVTRPHVPILRPRKKSKLNWAYYISPSISYRNYSNYGAHTDQMYLRYLNNSVTTDLNRAIKHRPSLGMEIGTAFKYSFAKKLKFTAGIQANYSSYTVQANNVHPIIATLVLHDEKTRPYAISSISYFGNGPGVIPENLKNYSLQLSIPIGLEYELTGNSDVQLSLAASLQPSLLASGRSYILSTDKRNYVTEPSLSRRWNMTTNIGPALSFNSNKFKWQIGPQLRYQLLSSFSNRYQVKEHLIDYGMRLSISK